MGAEFWKCSTPYNADLSSALEEAQLSIFESGQYYSAYKSVAEAITDNEDCRRQQQEAEDMPPSLKESLLEHYDCFIEALKALPDATTQGEKIRQLQFLNQETGTRSILDIERISPNREFGSATPLTKQELIQLFDTEEPTSELVGSNLGSIAGLCGRYMAVCMSVFRDGAPYEILFCGYSAD